MAGAAGRTYPANSVNRQTVTSWFFFLVLCLVTASAIVHTLDTLPAPAHGIHELELLCEGRIGRRPAKTPKEAFKHRAASCVSEQKIGRPNSLKTETSSPSRNKAFQTGRALFHLIGEISPTYRHLARSKLSGASNRGRGRPGWPNDTVNLIDLVRFQGPLKVHRRTRARGLERALFHNVVYFRTGKFDHLGAGFSGLDGIYCAMPAWRCTHIPAPQLV